MVLSATVVDNSAIMRVWILRAFRLSGPPIWEIHQAGHGPKALQVAARNWIDHWRVDVSMPVVNEIEHIVRIRKMPEITDLPAIFVSTESNRRIAILRKEGARSVRRPLSTEMLQAEAQRFLDSNRIAAESRA